ncbi:MAG TPA: formate--tetrahydrofolate ligase, partial [Nitrospiraceae bacterium]|nr:formate--tetrahydrofolate ligase [Nitrospiraceae bacterium]
HIANVKAFGLPAVVAINAFPNDPEDELRYVREQALAAGATASAVSTHWVDGGKGAVELARAVVQASQGPTAFTPLYPDSAPIKQKIETIVRRMYGAAGVQYEEQAEAQIETAAKLGFGHFPICMAKTPFSLSHDATLKGRPSGFTVPIKELRILAGAGFLTPICSGIQLMPGLPKRPAGEGIDIDPETGQILGLS